MMVFLSVGLLAGFGLAFVATLPPAVFALTMLAFAAAAVEGFASASVSIAGLTFMLTIMAGQVGYIAAQAARARFVELDSKEPPFGGS